MTPPRAAAVVSPKMTIFRRTVVVIIVFVLGSSGKVNGFNLDVRIPIVKSGGSDDLSYFGYSVAQHSDSRGEPRLLVGAPRDRNLQPNTERSGALWKCRLSADPNDCVQVPTDGKRLRWKNSSYGVYDGSLDRLESPINSEIKDGQWLGVEVKSQGEGGKVIVCAHRYTVRDVAKRFFRTIDSKRALLGMCYILEPDLSLPRNDAVGYKNVMAVRDAVGGKRLGPKFGFDDHAKWGVCQVGVSAAFVDDDEGSTALFGAPGCFTWRGNLFSQSLDSVRRYDVAVNHATLRRYSKNGLMGLSVTSGRFFDDRKMHFVSGAPHAGDENGDGSRTGRVYFFCKDSGSGNLLNLERKRTLKGEMYGAGFGYSMAKLEANGDRTPDLLVGAPFHVGGGAIYLYSSQGESISPQRHTKIIGRFTESHFGLAIANAGDLNMDGYEDFAVGAPYEMESGGAVFVFFGGPGRGLRSLVGLDDSSQLVILKAEVVADQIICGKDMAKNVPFLFSSSLSSFGSSLSGGMDMDRNGYPDLLVGAYLSNKVFLLRSRPVIDIKTHIDESHLKGIDPGQPGCPDDPNSKDSCFTFTACFKVQAVSNSSIRGNMRDRTGKGRRLDVNFSIEAEPKKMVSRVYLRLRDEKRDTSTLISKRKVVEGTLNLRLHGYDAERCTAVIAYVASSLRSDIQTPVEFAASYALVQAIPRMHYGTGDDGLLPDMNDYPILNQAQAKKKFQATFDKDCGQDDICQSGLIVYAKLTDRMGHELDRSNSGNGDSDLYQLELGSLDGGELVLEILIQNSLESAYEAVLEVNYPSGVSYIGMGHSPVVEEGTTGKSKTSTPPEVKNNTTLVLNLGNPFMGGAMSRIFLRFSPKERTEKKLIVFSLSAATSSVQVYDTLIFLNVIIVHRAEVKVVGGAYPERLHYSWIGGSRARGVTTSSSSSSSVNVKKTLSEIGGQVVHLYSVINAGPSPVEVLTVQIRWPLLWMGGNISVLSGNDEDWLLYLTHQPVLKNGRGFCILPPGHKPNPMNLRSSKANQEGSVDINMASIAQKKKLMLNNWHHHIGASETSPQPSKTLHLSDSDAKQQFLSDSESIISDTSVVTLGSSRSKRKRWKLRKKRETNMSPSTEPEVMLPRMRLVTLDCDGGAVKCLTFNCTLFNVAAKTAATIEVRSRLWNSTLAAVAADLHSYNSINDGMEEASVSPVIVAIYADARVIMDKLIMKQDNVSDDHVSVHIVAYPDFTGVTDHYPNIWIILLSIVVGFLVLVLISAALWKIGFFERQRHGAVSGNDEADIDLMFSAHFEKIALNSVRNHDML